ncbi:class I adenylate-forming enzyme family protein [Antarcticimicrobium luteum]|uniref:Long-chain fatty acid--CoA ligase n=1 Tax=Antarcticimicrobium luteum TaxID=2547397 RepID=A0A4R5V1N3_9RHOB|nr:AMP-binding protein [Antarcticimicrobium luteum]TDK45708.1 long-chain fatty acid--CoA ligase [Antarcticimicrobium luteum]
MTLAYLLATSARLHPGRPAISVGNEVRLDYAGLARSAAGIATYLAVRGLMPGDRVMLAMKNNDRYFTYLFGCWWGGFVAAPLNATLHPREMAGIVADLAPRLAICDPGIADGLGPLCPDLPILEHGSTEAARAEAADPAPLADCLLNDTAWIFFTSGTTGAPKGACLSHANLLAMSTAYLADVDSVGSGDCLLHLAATSHASGLFGLSFIARGAEHVLMPSGGYEAGAMRDILQARRAVSFFAPTPLLARMRRDGIGDLADGHIRTVLTGAGPVLAQDVRDAVETFGPRLWNGYGQGETPCTITAMAKAAIAEAVAADDDAALVSVGIPRSATAVRLLDPGGREVPQGEAGEVCVRGPTVMSGYLNRPEATRETLRDGWLHTGDTARFDVAGRLILLDRLKDVIISGGMNVYAREVEDVLSRHPGVLEVAVIGRPDPEWGEEVVALIVPAPEAAGDNLAESLDAMCLDRLARFKRPKAYQMRQTLPRNAAGKVIKSLLKKDISAGSLGNQNCSTILS